MPARNSFRYLFCAASILALVSCSGENGAQPPSATATAAPLQTGETIAPIDAPTEKVAPIPTAMETFRAMAPAQGLKATPLFATPVTDNDARVKRLEDAVQGMHADFETVMPTIVRMASMEKDMQDLIGRLRGLTASAAPAPLMPADPTMADSELTPVADEVINPTAYEFDWGMIDSVPTVATTTTQVSAAQNPVPQFNASKAGGITAIRVGDHGATTRIVMDMGVKASLNATIQGDGQQLVIDVPGLSWAAKPEALFKASALVAGYRYDKDRVVIDLRRPCSIKSRELLPADGKAGYRTVIDLVAAQSAAKTESAAPAAANAEADFSDIDSP